MNRYTPYYDPDEQIVKMSISDTGDWVHVVSHSKVVAGLKKTISNLESEKSEMQQRLEQYVGSEDHLHSVGIKAADWLARAEKAEAQVQKLSKELEVWRIHSQSEG